MRLLTTWTLLLVVVHGFMPFNRVIPDTSDLESWEPVSAALARLEVRTPEKRSLPKVRSLTLRRTQHKVFQTANYPATRPI